VVLGDGTSPGLAVKLDVGGFHFGVDDGFACAIFGDASGGSARCWGANDFGQLGDGTKSIVTEATKIAGTGWEAVRVGSRTACGIKAGQTFCWGDNRENKVAPNDDDTWSSSIRNRCPRARTRPTSRSASITSAR